MPVPPLLVCPELELESSGVRPLTVKNGAPCPPLPLAPPGVVAKSPSTISESPSLSTGLQLLGALDMRACWLPPAATPPCVSPGPPKFLAAVLNLEITGDRLLRRLHAKNRTTPARPSPTTADTATPIIAPVLFENPDRSLGSSEIRGPEGATSDDSEEVVVGDRVKDAYVVGEGELN
jgi:hypothetical protein